LSEQFAEEVLGGGRLPVAGADATADEPARAVDEVDRRRPPDAIDAPGDVAALIKEHRCDIPAVLHNLPHVLGRLAKVDQEDFEALLAELTVQRVDGR